MNLKTAIRYITAFILVFTATGTPAALEAAVSIKPIHSLVASVMHGTGTTPTLIVDEAGSPHSYSLKPSKARAIEKASLIFWIGPALETFLQKPITTIGASAKVVTLLDTPELITLTLREGGDFDKHHDHEEAGKGGVNTHLWLDPQNSKILAKKIRDVLIEIDPANTQSYTANTKTLLTKLDNLTAKVTTMLAPVKDKHPIFFHDAYQYFEHRFGITAAGTITVNPEVMPGAERLMEIQAIIKRLEVSCVFSESQFQPKFIHIVSQGSDAKYGVLDPLGASLTQGPALYFELIENMAQSVLDCLR